MNLTKCFVASLCLTAMTVSAVDTVDAFEDGIYSGGWSGSINLFYGDVGHVVDGDAFTGIPPYTLARPMTGVSSNRVLRLDTEGGVWTNMVGVPFGAAPVFVDMLVKFVPSEDLPSLDASVKLAVAVTNGYLVVTKNGNNWNATTQPIDTNTWYRFSAELRVATSSNWIVDPSIEPEGGYWNSELSKKAIVKINENIVSVGGESQFVISDFLGTSTLTSIGFSGTGFVDEIVVRDTDPFAPTTVKFAGSGIEILDEPKYNAWLSTNGLNSATVKLEHYNAFLWNVAPDGDTSPNLKVGSITIVGTTITLTVVAKYASSTELPINVNALNNNAQAVVFGEVELSGAAWATPITGSTDLIFAPGTYNFYKVKIQ